MSKVSFFLGAGASAAFGYSTTVGFIHKLNSQMKKLGYAEMYNEITSFIAARDGDDTVDIEKVLLEFYDLDKYLKKGLDDRWFKRRYLLGGKKYYREDDVGNRYFIDKDFRDGIELIDILIKEIHQNIYNEYWTIPQEINDRRSEKAGIKDTYMDLFGQFDNTDYDIFTTNYDVSLDTIFLESLELKDEYSDGFVGDIAGAYWKSDFKGKKYRYFKLHGSVSWKKHNDGIIRVPFHSSTPLDDNILLYPGEHKQPSKEPFKTLYNQLQVKLSEAEVFIIIGFSFRDPLINELFLIALERNEELKYIIWNPSDIKHNFTEKRFIHFKDYFSHQNIDKFMQIYNEV